LSEVAQKHAARRGSESCPTRPRWSINRNITRLRDPWRRARQCRRVYRSFATRPAASAADTGKQCGRHARRERPTLPVREAQRGNSQRRPMPPCPPQARAAPRFRRPRRAYRARSAADRPPKSAACQRACGGSCSASATRRAVARVSAWRAATRRRAVMQARSPTRVYVSCEGGAPVR